MAKNLLLNIQKNLPQGVNCFANLSTEIPIPFFSFANPLQACSQISPRHSILKALPICFQNSRLQEKSVLEKADSDNKAELNTKIDEAYAALDASIKAVKKSLDELKASLEAKDNELLAKDESLETMIVILFVISGMALCAGGTSVALIVVKGRRSIK